MADEERQRIVRVAGSRRAQLTPVQGTTSEPHARADRKSPPKDERGPNDERMLGDVPPHY
ncbi:hypothetical protein [Microbacterium sp. H1-D42]|uniref:hypothetical protein n=1 Tax=Microbacterium sp. H1-D42 TaxID=2925844 RepID=UPI001F534D81|nr:hypothetical protein [Microbacterium sp. H1-D42]UNK71818.1 hypothetical protein MNR00_05000 [Microbacterium sp. H1-D42]